MGEEREIERRIERVGESGIDTEMGRERLEFRGFFFEVVRILSIAMH